MLNKLYSRSKPTFNGHSVTPLKKGSLTGSWWFIPNTFGRTAEFLLGNTTNVNGGFTDKNIDFQVYKTVFKEQANLYLKTAIMWLPLTMIDSSTGPWWFIPNTFGRTADFLLGNTANVNDGFIDKNIHFQVYKNK
jgi:hypothetical protein